MAAAARLDFRILGPLEVSDAEGRHVELTAAKHRALLTCLVLRAGEPVATDRLVDALWGERPPASAPKLVQVYVSQVRRALGNGMLETRAPGYLVRAAPEDIDARRFERLFAEGREALAAGNAALAVARLRRALDLWRGPALADVAWADFAAGEASRLDELRLDCIEEWIAAELELGRQDHVLAELAALVGEQPFRERLARLHMLALYRAGRQPEALEVYQEVRRQLGDELGLEPGAALRELQQAILRHDSELAAPTAEAPRVGSLPVPLTPLVGRDRELAELRELVVRPEARLVTLAGAAGSGKTRLALALAHACDADFANGSALVELASVHEPDLVVPAIAHALGVTDSAGRTIRATLAGWLAGRELLLVLDNLEHLVEAAPALVELAAGAPHVTLVVTSRRVLHVSGEHVYPVQPLGLDHAVELFVQRARSQRPGFVLTDDVRTAVREICRRVDGLPLAVELAAARTRTLAPGALLERLSRRLSVLSGGPRDLPARQQTLRETLDWSANLLSDGERSALVGLALFPGGCTLPAAEAVCDADLDAVAALVDHSLVSRVERDGEPRFTLLETVREYALERLADAADLGELARRHAEWYLALAEAAEPQLTGENQTSWFATLEAEHDNLRAALAHLAVAGAQETSLRLTIALTRFWYVRGYLTEARRWLDAVLADAADQPVDLRRRALTAASAVALLQGDYAAAADLSERSLAVSREAGEPLYVANALSNLGAIVLAAGDHDRAGALLEEAVPLARETGDARITALAVNNLGDHALTVGDYERAGPLFEESLALLRARRDTANIARALFNLGAVSLKLGRHGDARRHLRESLALCDAAGDKEDIAWCLEGFAALAAAEGDGTRAALLLGAATTTLDAMGAALKPFERQLHEDTEGAARAALGSQAFEATRAHGAALPLAEAGELALAER
jgi:predicted ATPase/DNA-binding SARP family transcriptional activator/Tfp pilus assembly protein PilF